MMTRQNERGYVLLGSLLMAVLLVTMTMSYARHALLSGSADASLLKVELAEASTSSGLAWAKQSLLVDGNTRASLSIDGGSRIDISVVDTGSDTRAITVKTAGAGYEQQVTATAQVFAVTSDELPRLTTSGRDAVANSRTIIEVAEDTTFINTELTGILFVRNGVTLTLNDVVIDGTIVTEPALSASGWSAAQATTIRINGGLLVDPGTTLPGCAIIAPDATIVGNGDDRVQLHGVVVCDSLTLPGIGYLHSQIAMAGSLTLSDLVQMPGSGRAPRPWPDTIDTGAQSVGRIHFKMQIPTESEKAKIRAFAFPAKVAPVKDLKN